MPDSTHVTNIHNHVSVPRDTIVIVPSPAPVVVVNSVDYTYQAWGFILVLLVISILFYYKKTFIAPPAQCEPTKLTSDTTEFDPSCIPSWGSSETVEKMTKEGIYRNKIKFDEPSDVSLPVDTITARKI